MEVLQTSALPLGYGAAWNGWGSCGRGLVSHKTVCLRPRDGLRQGNFRWHYGAKVGAGNGIRTRDFDLGKVALYH